MAAKVPGDWKKWVGWLAEQTEGRFKMAAEAKKGEGPGFDVAGLAKAWKESYVKGLEACLQWQEESERLVKTSCIQGFSGPRQWLNLYKEWMDMPWDQIQGQAIGVPNPFLIVCRQCAQACHASVDPLLKTAEATVENSFSLYDSAIGTPSRKYVRDLNKQVLESVIPG